MISFCCVSAAILHILAEQTLGVVLRFLHVGLIEGIDAEQRSRNRGGKFPQEEFLAQIERIVQRMAQHRMAGGLERRQLGLNIAGLWTTGCE